MRSNGPKVILVGAKPCLTLDEPSSISGAKGPGFWMNLPLAGVPRGIDVKFFTFKL